MHASHNAAAPRRMPAWVAGALLAAVITGLVAYRPDVAWPFDMVDFSEFLPLLEQNDSFMSRLSALNAYYEQHGRMNVLQYAGTVARWDVFGTWSPGWQVTRMVVMLGVILCCGMLLRRLGATRLGAVAGAACFLVAPPAASAWVRLTMAEAIGTLVMLLLTWRALGFRDRPSWKGEVAIQAGGAIVLLLLKEMFAPLLLLPMAAALATQAGGAWRFARPDRRHVMLLGTVAVAGVVVALPIALVFAQAPRSGYVSLLGAQWIPPEAVAALWAAAVLPFRFIPERMSIPWLLAMLSWLTIGAIGWGTAFRNPGRKTHHVFWLALAFGWPLLGIVIYTPWPAFASFYGVPYLIGPAVFIGFGLSFVQRHAAHGTLLATVLAALPGIVAATDAQEYASRRHASQVTAHRLIDWVTDSVRVDSIFVASTESHRLVMAGPGPTLGRHAAATHRPWPPARDFPCAPGAAPAFAPGAVIWATWACREVRGPAQVVVRYGFMDWSRWRPGRDSVIARVEVSPNGA